ncbi:hypothetical protein [Leminorella grimontii]|nr:hypothetical protein [Leminorella grimontii]
MLVRQGILDKSLKGETLKTLRYSARSLTDNFWTNQIKQRRKQQ